MERKSFFPPPKPLSVAELISATGAILRDGGDPDRRVGALAPLDAAGPDDLSFLDNPKYAGMARETRAAVCFSAAKYADHFPASTTVLVCAEPYQAYAIAGALLYPEAMTPRVDGLSEGISSAAHVASSARIEEGVIIGPGAVIGEECEIGSGTRIAAHAVIGDGVSIGRNSSVGAGCVISHAFIGDDVIIHPNCSIGQDGFGFAMGLGGHRKVVQIGRVVIQSKVEIGAGTCIDRGASRDTIIGEGTKIDNMVQIAHNVVIGRHCVIAAQAGIAGSTELGDYVALGGQAGIIGHVKLGDGAQIAAASAVKDPVPAGARWGGLPAKPLRDLARELAAVARLTKKEK